MHLQLDEHIFSITEEDIISLQKYMFILFFIANLSYFKYSIYLQGTYA